MRLKIRCDGESEKFCKIFWELNKAYVLVVKDYSLHFLGISSANVLSVSTRSH